MEELFKEKKKSKKTLILVISIILVILGLAFGGYFVYTKYFANKDGNIKEKVVAATSNIHFLDKYLDMQGMVDYVDEIDSSNFHYTTNVNINSEDIDKEIESKFKLENVKSQDFNIKIEGQVEPKIPKIYNKILLDYKNKNLSTIELLDSANLFLIYFQGMFKEHIGIEKDKISKSNLKHFNISEKDFKTFQQIYNQDGNKNVLKEQKLIMDSIINSIPKGLELLNEENFKYEKNVSLNFRNNKLKANKIIIDIDEVDYEKMVSTIETEAKTKASTGSIDVKSIIGNTDQMISSYMKYFRGLIKLEPSDKLEIRAYMSKDEILKIDIVKINKNDENNVQNVFEIEFNNKPNVDEILLSNQYFKLKINSTKDNSKIYTNIMLDGKLPLPSKNEGGNNLTVLPQEKKNENRRDNQEQRQERPQEVLNNNNFTQDITLKMMDIKLEVGYTRDKLSNDEFSFNINTEIGKTKVMVKNMIGKKEQLDIPNPVKVVKITSMNDKTLKQTKKIIDNELKKKVYSAMQEIKSMSGR